MTNLIIGLIIGSIIGIFLMCLLQINRDNDTDNELYKRICDAMDYINFLVIFDDNINGKFNETIWGKELLDILGGDLNDEIEIIEEVEDKEYENITEVDNKFHFTGEEEELALKINALIRNQKKIIERLDK